MKGKVLIVLVSLALVFGLLAASCDNGTAPANPYKTDSHKFAGEFEGKPDDSDILDIIGEVFGEGDGIPATVYVDFVDNATPATKTGDGIADYADGKPLTMSKSAAQKLKDDGDKISEFDPETGTTTKKVATYDFVKLATGDLAGEWSIKRLTYATAP